MGGTEIHVAEIAKRMVARGHEAHVVSADGDGRSTTETIDGVQVTRVRSLTASDLFLAPAMANVVRRFDGDLLHVQGYHTFTAPIALTAGHAAELPTVLTFHSGGHDSSVRRFIRPLQRRGLRPLISRADHLIGVSHFESAFFARTLGLPLERFSTIPNGTDFDRDLAGPDGAAPEDNVVCSVGRLEKYKGHHRAIAALPPLRELVPDARLEIVGTGPYEPELRALALELGVEDHVTFLSFPASDRAGLVRTLRRASLVVLLSEYESQGMTILEAMALGRPVLVSNTSALGALARDHGAQAVPIDLSPNGLAERIAGTLGMGDAAVPASPDVHRWDEIADRIERLYRRVLAGTPVRS